MVSECKPLKNLFFFECQKPMKNKWFECSKTLKNKWFLNVANHCKANGFRMSKTNEKQMVLECECEKQLKNKLFSTVKSKWV